MPPPTAETPEGDVRRRAIRQNYFVELPIDVAHAVTAGELPGHHRDPFDRMLVAQAQLEHLTVVADDAELAKYEVERLDARR